MKPVPYGEHTTAMKRTEFTSHPERSILVVDDEPDLRDLLSETLTEEGFQVHTAPSGEAALEHLAGGKPADLVLMDLVMPGISGIEAAKRIRQMRPVLPVVLISGAPPPVHPWPPPEAAAFFAKPLDLKRLVAELRALL